MFLSRKNVHILSAEGLEAKYSKHESVREWTKMSTWELRVDELVFDVFGRKMLSSDNHESKVYKIDGSKMEVEIT